MSQHVLVTMQVTTRNNALGDPDIEARLAALVRECFDADAEHASISVQAYDPDAPAEDDVCATCGCVIGDAEQHAEWHRAPLRALGMWRAAMEAGTDEPDELRTFGEEPAHA